MHKLHEAIRKMFLAREELHSTFPKKPFTPDGRMIGDIGEAIAEIYYKVTIDSKLRKHWDGLREDDNYKFPEVQVKATQKDETYLKEPPHDGSLLVFKIYPDGKHECCYNGSIVRVWEYLVKQKPDKTNAKIISLVNLKSLNDKISDSSHERIAPRKI